MPGIGGMEAASNSPNEPDIRVIALTIHTEDPFLQNYANRCARLFE